MSKKRRWATKKRRLKRLLNSEQRAIVALEVVVKEHRVEFDHREAAESMLKQFRRRGDLTNAQWRYVGAILGSIPRKSATTERQEMTDLEIMHAGKVLLQ